MTACPECHADLEYRAAANQAPGIERTVWMCPNPNCDVITLEITGVA